MAIKASFEDDIIDILTRLLSQSYCFSVTQEGNCYPKKQAYSSTTITFRQYGNLLVSSNNQGRVDPMGGPGALMNQGPHFK